MGTKLTLVLDPPVIERAKDYARRDRTSRSRMLQEYLAAVTRGEAQGEVRYGPLTASLCGLGRLPPEEAALSDKEMRR